MLLNTSPVPCMTCTSNRGTRNFDRERSGVSPMRLPLHSRNSIPSHNSRRRPSWRNSWELDSLSRSSPWSAAFGRNSESATITNPSPRLSKETDSLQRQARRVREYFLPCQQPSASGKSLLTRKDLRLATEVFLVIPALRVQLNDSPLAGPGLKSSWQQQAMSRLEGPSKFSVRAQRPRASTACSRRLSSHPRSDHDGEATTW